MHISTALIGLVLLIVSIIYAAFVEKGVNSSVLALWGILVTLLSAGLSFG